MLRKGAEHAGHRLASQAAGRWTPTTRHAPSVPAGPYVSRPLEKKRRTVRPKPASPLSPSSCFTTESVTTMNTCGKGEWFKKH